MKTKIVQQVHHLLFSNVSAKQTIFKNTLWLTVSTGANKIFSLVLVIYAARILGAEGYGQFSFALAFASLLMIFSDLGLATIVTREFAREEKKDEWYAILSLKFVLALVTFLLIALLSFFIAPNRDVQLITLVLALFLLVNSILDTVQSFFHARQKMEYAAFFEVLQAFLIFGFGLFALLRFPSPLSLSYAYLLAALVASLFALLFFHLKIFPLSLKWDFSIWKRFLRMSWPLALMGLFGLLYSYIDSVMLGYLGMLKETGWYSAAQKIVMAGLIPMGLIASSLYPALSKFSKESKEKLQKAWSYELEIMVVLALPLVVGGFILAPQIIDALYPADFVPAILAFQILIFSAGLIFLYRPLYDAMIVSDQQGKVFWITMIGALANVVLNLMLIPKYSLYGAAFATVCTQALVLGAIIVFTVKLTPLRFPVAKTVLILLAAGFCSFVMWLLLRQLSLYHLSVFFLVPAGAAAYFAAFFMIRKYVLLPYAKQFYDA